MMFFEHASAFGCDLARRRDLRRAVLLGALLRFAVLATFMLSTRFG
jgi:hypothetical protein